MTKYLEEGFALDKLTAELSDKNAEFYFATLDKSIYELVRQSSELSLVSLFVPLFAGLYWKRASPWGCMASMIVGLLVWLVATYSVSEYPPIVYGLFASIAGMVVFSILEKKTNQYGR